MRWFRRRGKTEKQEMEDLYGYRGSKGRASYLRRSSEDTEIARRLVQAGGVLSIEVLDHLLVGDGCWMSLKERGSRRGGVAPTDRLGQ